MNMNILEKHSKLINNYQKI